MAIDVALALLLTLPAAPGPKPCMEQPAIAAHNKSADRRA
jgi:hypothetical protein